MIPVLKGVAIVFSAFIKPSWSPWVFTPYGVDH